MSDSKNSMKKCNLAKRLKSSNREMSLKKANLTKRLKSSDREISMKKCNLVKRLISSAFRVLAKVYINIIDPEFKINGKEIYKCKKLVKSLIKKIKTHQNYKNDNAINQSYIDKLLKLKFRDFLKLAKFPFKEEKKCSIKLPDKMFNILKANAKEEEKIREIKNKGIIFIDKIKSYNKSKKKEEKSKNNNTYYKSIIDGKNNKSFIEFLDLKCSEIINIIISAFIPEENNENYLNKKRKRDIEDEESKNNVKKDKNGIDKFTGIMHEKKESEIVPSKSKNLVVDSDEKNDFVIEISNSGGGFGVEKENDENLDFLNQDNKDNSIDENYNKDNFYLENEQTKQIDMFPTKFSTENNEYNDENENEKSFSLEEFKIINNEWKF